MSKICAIVGTGHAATQLAFSLRKEGWQDRILMIGEEPHTPYHRPPLSKAFLAGEKRLEQIQLKRASTYEKSSIELLISTRVERIDRDQKRLELAGAAPLPYDKLALATGSRPRRINLPGSDLPGIHYLRNADDATALKACFHPGARLVIIGGGYIGLEVAAVAVQAGVDVTLLEMAERVLQRVTSPEVADFFTRVHRQAGVKLHTGVQVSHFEGNGQVERVICADGQSFSADAVLVAVGIEPAVELAEQAGLSVDNGIRVDEYTRTDDPDIVAAGDCTNHPNALLGRRVRLESVQNAMDQARTAAVTLAGKEQPYRELPWFWSDQYDLTLQIAGLSQGYEKVVIRGDTDERSFAAFYLQQGRVIAVDAINQLETYLAGQRLITSGIEVDPADLTDPATDLKTLTDSGRP